MDEKLDQILLNSGGGAGLDFISDDPMSSARGIDAEWNMMANGGASFTLPHEPNYIYSFFRNGIEQESSQYSIVGTTLTVFPSLGSLTGGENESLTLKYKYLDN